MKISKINYSPNDRFLIKIFIKIISLDSSQRVPPMSPCPPLIITTVCPWLINHLSDPWDFNNSNGILLRSNWRKPYPKFYGSSFYGSGYVYLGVIKKTSQKVPPYLLGEGGPFINPVLPLYHKTVGHDISLFYPWDSLIEIWNFDTHPYRLVIVSTALPHAASIDGASRLIWSVKKHKRVVPQAPIIGDAPHMHAPSSLVYLAQIPPKSIVRSSHI